MNSLLLRGLAMPRSSSLQAFSEYRDAEAGGARTSSVTTDGALLEYETLELRVHPPNVEIDTETYDDRTVVTVDSANRPGTLVECVQTLTELGLNVCRARISSDGGWFHDEFHVTESNGKKVRRPLPSLPLSFVPSSFPRLPRFLHLPSAPLADPPQPSATLPKPSTEPP